MRLFFNAENLDSWIGTRKELRHVDRYSLLLRRLRCTVSQHREQHHTRPVGNRERTEPTHRSLDPLLSPW
jgi:hypothetical protein